MRHNPERLRILVAVGGKDVDGETVRMACRMAQKAPGDAREPALVYGVHVIEVNRSLPVSAPVEAQVQAGEEALDAAESAASEYPVQFETELVQARDTGPAIVGEAQEWKADVIVMGLPYKRRFGEFNLGRTAPYVLRHAPCRVILFRERLE